MRNIVTRYICMCLIIIGGAVVLVGGVLYVLYLAACSIGYLPIVTAVAAFILAVNYWPKQKQHAIL